MNARELKARIEAARAFSVTHGSIVFECVAPSRLDMRSAMRGHNQGVALDMDAMLRALVPAHVRGWKHATQGHLVDGLDASEAAEGVPFSLPMLDAFFQKDTDAFDEVCNEMIDQYNKREASKEDALKN